MIERVLIRGTTPMISVGFKEIDVADIDKAYLVVKHNGIDVIKLDFERATVNLVNNSISWTLTQKETLMLKPFRVAIVTTDWVLKDGTRGRGAEVAFSVENAGIEEAI